MSARSLTVALPAIVVMSMAAPALANEVAAGKTAEAEAEAEGEEAIEVGVYMPSLFFLGATEKANFLSEFERTVGEALGTSVAASFSANLDSIKEMPILLIDIGEAARRAELEVILRAVRGKQSSIPVAIYGRKAWPSAFELLRRGRVLLPGGGKVEKDILRYWLLLDEPLAAKVSAAARPVRDARVALTSVAAGEADGAVAYEAAYGTLDPTLGALKKISWLRELPLPVLVINGPVAGKAKAEQWRGKLRKSRGKLPTVPGIFTGWKNASAGDKDLVAVLRSVRSRSSPIGRGFVLAPLPPFTLDLVPFLPPPPDAPELDATIVWPQQRFEPLPDPPLEQPSQEPPTAAATP